MLENRKMPLILVCCLFIAAMGSRIMGDEGSKHGDWDPLVAAAMAQMNQKQSAATHYTCALRNTTTSGKNTTITDSKIAFQRPNFWSEELKVTQSPIPGNTGEQDRTIFDGKTIWQDARHAPGSEKEKLQKYSTLPPTELQEMARKHLTPQIFSWDAKKLIDNGAPLGMAIANWWINDPLWLCEASSVRIEKEDEKEWTFKGKSTPAGPPNSEWKVIVSKETGFTTRLELMIQGPTSTMVVSDMKINPEPKIEEKYYHYTPPAGIAVKDLTDSVIQSTKAK